MLQDEDREREERMQEPFQLEQMEKETKEMLKLRYLTKENCTFQRTPGGFVSLTVGDEHYDRIQVFCTFPFTDRYRCVSIRESTEKAKEIGIIQDLNQDLDAETVAMIQEQISLRYFTPVITKIKSVKEEYGFAYFDVETDHGPCRFAIHMSGSAVVHLSETRVLFLDLDENRFEIPDLTALSTKEQKKISVFL